jgi:hypothetical protein
MPEHDVVLRHPDGREEHRLVSWPGELDVGHSFTFEGDEWLVAAKEPGSSHGVRSPSVLVCEQRRT